MATTAKTIWVNISMDKAIDLVAATDGSLVSIIRMHGEKGNQCAVAIFEKYYARMRASSVATLVFDSDDGNVKIICVCAGAGSNPDFGANMHFQKAILNALSSVAIDKP